MADKQFLAQNLRWLAASFALLPSKEEKELAVCLLAKSMQFVEELQIKIEPLEEKQVTITQKELEQSLNKTTFKKFWKKGKEIPQQKLQQQLQNIEITP